MIYFDKYVYDSIKNVFDKYLKLTGLDKDNEFYRSVLDVERDVKFYQELVCRTKSYSKFSFDVKVSMSGLIYNGFFNKINAYWDHYDYKILTYQLYVFEVLKRLFNKHWIDGVGVDKDVVQQIEEFHPIVTYYVSVENIGDYIGDFIGSSYGIEQFRSSLKVNLPQP